METKLATLGLLSIATFMAVAATVGLPALENSLFGKFLITFIVLGGVIPWLYLLHQTKGKVNMKTYAICFVGTWLLAPFFLLKIGASKNAP
ncbi:MAG: hypothetical protein ABW096_11840 [Candidatus Thiodiazotropha sp.]